MLPKQVLPKKVRNFTQYKTNTHRKSQTLLKFFQSDKISPNLVTLEITQKQSKIAKSKRCKEELTPGSLHQSTENFEPKEQSFEKVFCDGLKPKLHRL